MSRPSANGEAVVEVLTTVHRRRWTVAEKVQLVQESLQPGMNVSYVARRNGLSPSQLFRWRKLMSDGGKAAVQADDQVVGAGDHGAQLVDIITKCNASAAAPTRA